MGKTRKKQNSFLQSQSFTYAHRLYFSLKHFSLDIILYFCLCSTTLSFIVSCLKLFLDIEVQDMHINMYLYI